jgi:phospholipase C
LTVPSLLATADASTATAGFTDDQPPTTTPIKHVVVVFQENVPFDHYFGTYPHALNLPGEPHFTARPGTPSVNGLTDTLLNFNPNSANHGTTYGPSHVGVLNLVSGQTHGAVATGPTSDIVDGTMIANVEPTYDDCPVSPLSAHMTGRNIGNLLNDHHVTWGWFSDGFRPTSRLPDGTAVCDKAATNPHHLPPTSVAAIGHQDQANHQYDLTDFWAAAEHGNLPAVSFVKSGGYQQGGGDSDPLDEQNFLVNLSTAWNAD